MDPPVGDRATIENSGCTSPRRACGISARCPPPRRPPSGMKIATTASPFVTDGEGGGDVHTPRAGRPSCHAKFWTSCAHFYRTSDSRDARICEFFRQVRSRWRGDETRAQIHQQPKNHDRGGPPSYAARAAAAGARGPSRREAAARARGDRLGVAEGAAGRRRHDSRNRASERAQRILSGGDDSTVRVCVGNASHHRLRLRMPLGGVAAGGTRALVVGEPRQRALRGRRSAARARTRAAAGGRARPTAPTAAGRSRACSCG